MIRKIVPKTAIVAVALGALASAALAEPLELNEAQMDQVTAGLSLVDASGNLYDIYGIPYIYNPSTNTYIDSEGFTWWHTKQPINLTSGYVNAVLTNGTLIWDGGYQ
jgi:hypothetical protein